MKFKEGFSELQAMHQLNIGKSIESFCGRGDAKFSRLRSESSEPFFSSFDPLSPHLASMNNKAFRIKLYGQRYKMLKSNMHLDYVGEISIRNAVERLWRGENIKSRRASVNCLAHVFAGMKWNIL